MHPLCLPSNRRPRAAALFLVVGAIAGFAQVSVANEECSADPWADAVVESTWTTTSPDVVVGAPVNEVLHVDRHPGVSQVLVLGVADAHGDRTVAHPLVSVVNVQVGRFPPDSHLDGTYHLPAGAGVEDYLPVQRWVSETPLGGNYNRKGPDHYPYAAVSVLNHTAPASTSRADRYPDSTGYTRPGRHLKPAQRTTISATTLSRGSLRKGI